MGTAFAMGTLSWSKTLNPCRTSPSSAVCAARVKRVAGSPRRHPWTRTYTLCLHARVRVRCLSGTRPPAPTWPVCSDMLAHRPGKLYPVPHIDQRNELLNAADDIMLQVRRVACGTRVVCSTRVEHGHSCAHVQSQFGKTPMGVRRCSRCVTRSPLPLCPPPLSPLPSISAPSLS